MWDDQPVVSVAGGRRAREGGEGDGDHDAGAVQAAVFRSGVTFNGFSVRFAAPVAAVPKPST